MSDAFSVSSFYKKKSRSNDNLQPTTTTSDNNPQPSTSTSDDTHNDELNDPNSDNSESSDPDYEPSSGLEDSCSSLTTSDSSYSRSEQAEDENQRITDEANHDLAVYLDWEDVTGSNQKDIIFIGHPGIQPTIPILNSKPLDIYMTLIEGVIDLTVTETNRNAVQIIEKMQFKPKSRMKKWKPTDREEITHFFGIIMYMGIVKYPKITDYWSKKVIYNNQCIPNIMSRNRFQLLLRFIHFQNNENQAPGDKLFKIRNIIKILINNFQKSRIPSEVLVVDETMVPWRGRLSFRQYIKGKAHKYGVKLFKLCGTDGYTYNFSVYAGKNRAPVIYGLATDVVLDLTQSYLNEGRTTVTDNFYTSVLLAQLLLAENTHLLGTLRKNRKNNPKEIIEAQLKKGELIAKESQDGIVVLKWRDKRNVLMLSTKHTDNLVATGKKDKQGEDIMKPEMIVDYNKGKQGIDVSDQLASYFSPLRKSIRWYHKVVFELLFGTALVNSHLLFNIVNNSRLQIIDYFEALIEQMLGISSEPIPTPPATPNIQMRKHKLAKETERDIRNKLKRKACKKCYSEMRRSGQPYQVAHNKCKRVSTFCDSCPNKPFLCLECFNNSHLD